MPANALRGFSNEELAAFNTSASLYGNVPDLNCAHAKCLELGFISIDGTVRALFETRKAISHVILERKQAGEWM